MVGADVALTGDPNNGLAVWAQGAREVHQLAEHVAQSALVPQAYRGKPVDVLACWLTGQELGIPPMTALRSIDVVKGTPSLRAHAMRALVLSRGHQVQLVESTPARCVMRGRRKGEQEWTPDIEWTIDRAAQMGLIGKVAEGKVYDPKKDQWVTQPQTMLIARATGEVCRLVAPDVLYGVPYATEEVGDMEPIQAEATVDRPPTIAELVAQKSTPAAASEPVSAPPVTAEPPPQGITGPQSKKLHSLFNEAGIAERESRLSWVSDILGRDVASSSDLSRVEAAQVIEQVQIFVNERNQPAAPAEGEQP